MLSRSFLASHVIKNRLITTNQKSSYKILHFYENSPLLYTKTEFHYTQFIENHNKLMNAAYTVATLVETDKFGMTTNGLGRLANRGEADYIVKITKSFHSLVLIKICSLKVVDQYCWSSSE